MLKDKKLKSTKEIIETLLLNRGVKTKQQIKDFYDPELSKFEDIKIDKNELKKAVKRINIAIEKKELIVIYGDYDADGVCATAILWETLNKKGAKVLPYIPHRREEGYGLSIKGISNVITQMPEVKLVVTVDNGIVAKEAVDYAKDQGLDVIVTDHHTLEGKPPKALAIIHSTEISGAAVAWFLALQFKTENPEFKIEDDEHLGLVALSTITDMMPVLGVNRAILKQGLKKLNLTKRVGLLAIYQEAGINLTNSIGTYEIGFMIGPRLNAMGRMEFAMDSLRLLCTKDKVKARLLAEKLGKTNKERQTLTQETLLHAISQVKKGKKSRKLLFISDEIYEQGVIGLVAGKLVEQFYRPSIVVSVGQEYSKASARSVSGFNITDFIRNASDLLVNVGGHPMAAGFTVETVKLSLLRDRLDLLAQKMIEDRHLIRELKVDCKIPLNSLSLELAQEIEKMAPFGIGNPVPLFSSDALLEDLRLVGQGKHLKLGFKIHDSNFRINGIWFGAGESLKNLAVGDKVKIIYSLEKDVWNGSKRIQLKIRDIK